MHVLQVGNNVVSTMGGTPRAIRDVQRAIGGDIVSFTSPGLAETAEGTLHVPHSASRAGRLYGWAKAADQERARERFDHCDIVFIHGLFRHHYQWAVRTARDRALPYLIFPHGSLDPKVFAYRGAQKRIWWSLIGQPGLSGAAGVVFTTARERDKAATRAALPARRYVIPLPVPAPPIEGHAELRRQERARLGIDAAQRVLLFLGRFDRIKRLPVIIEAFNRADAHDLHLVIAGPDSLDISSAECRRLVAGHARNRVHFTGAVYGADKHRVLASADAFVSISARENFGYSLCEALAAGLPAILGPGTDLGPALAAARCGWLIERDGVEAVARVFRELSAVPSDLLREMGGNGQAWVRRHLSDESFRQALLQVCEQAAARARR